MIRDTASGYSVHHFFIGTDGWSMRTGFTNKDQLRAQAVRDMAHSCEHVTVLTESNKFDDIGTVPINIKDLPISVITDCNLSAGIQNKMKSEGIEVIEV
jgi:DeoR/GlpR family transcriptional regulator of sugar metabolism